MHTFIHFWTNHVAGVPAPAIAFLQTYAKITTYPAGAHLMRPGDLWPYWNFVEEGAVMALRYHADGGVEPRWLVTAGTYFTGTVHAFTSRRDDVFIRCLLDTRVVQLPNYRLQEAQRLYHSVSELINILKQHRIEQDAVLDSVFRHVGGEARVAAFFDAYPRVVPQLSRDQLCAVLRVSPSTYQRAKRRYYRRR